MKLFINVTIMFLCIFSESLFAQSYNFDPNFIIQNKVMSITEWQFAMEKTGKNIAQLKHLLVSIMIWG